LIPKTVPLALLAPRGNLEPLALKVNPDRKVLRVNLEKPDPLAPKV
jgi:hypothetical protein